MNEQEPEVTVLPDGRERYKHPAYATLYFGRCNGGEMPLFGSSIKHNSYIRMTLSHAEMERAYNMDHVYPKQPIADVYMSYSQFVEAISNMNKAEGTPVTLRQTEKDGNMPGVTFKNKRVQISDEFRDHIKNNSARAKQLSKHVKELLSSSKKPLTKQEKEDIISTLDKITMDMDCNTAFILDQFNESLDNTVAEAKGEVESFVQNKMLSIANNAIVENPDILTQNMSPIRLELDDKPDLNGGTTNGTTDS